MVRKLVAIVLAVFAVACLVAQQSIAGRRLSLFSRGGSGINDIWLIDGKVAVSWTPRTPYRPQWAGQANRYGFRYNLYSNVTGYAWAPLWVPTAAAGLISACLFALGWLRRRPEVGGRCPACGYDLRASPERCPECGRPTTDASKQNTAAVQSG